jgi:rod shape-determining protein MreC
LQRVTFPLLFLLSVTMIILGKADQVMLESVRVMVADAAAPVLDVLSRPLFALADLATRARRLVAAYRDNDRLTEENERLIGWQQAALRLASENSQLRRLEGRQNRRQPI